MTNTNLSWSYIDSKLLWLAKVGGCRITGTYAEIGHYWSDEDCRDFDILCADGQPEELRPFVTAYSAYGREHGFITLKDFYSVWAAPAPARKIWTEERIRELLASNDKMLVRSLMKLYERQTEDEQEEAATSHRNGMGFSAVDAGIMTSFAEFYKRTGFLTQRQKDVCRRKIVKYVRQITLIANS